MTAYTVLGYSVFTMCMDAKIMPTNDTDYSCHINHKTYSMDTHAHMHAHRHLRTEAILRRQACTGQIKKLFPEVNSFKQAVTLIVILVHINYICTF